MNLSGKVCLVTGGTRGIGAAGAMALAEAGGDVAIVGRREDEEAKGTKAAIQRLGRKCLLIGADVGKAADAMDCVERTVSELGGIDVLVHSAGGAVEGGLLELTPEAWYGAFEVHVHPIFHLCRAAIPHMRKKKEGVVILVSSTAGIRGIKTNVAYQVVKGAIPQLTR